ncbi:MAG TPA: hypothetical protein VNN73_00010 [Blastocatellia bacterium]|nr:hypothetical protein [Blastocatellia bacterium]
MKALYQEETAKSASEIIARRIVLHACVPTYHKIFIHTLLSGILSETAAQQVLQQSMPKIEFNKRARVLANDASGRLPVTVKALEVGLNNKTIKPLAYASQR